MSQATVPAYFYENRSEGPHIQPLARTLDTGLAGLMRYLHESGMISGVTVLVLGDFGRTPRINQSHGRDHWPGPVTVVMGGAGIEGGQVYGEVDATGEHVLSGPVSVYELFATIYAALGIDLNDRNRDLHDNLGRRFYLTGERENAEPIKELLKTAREY